MALTWLSSVTSASCATASPPSPAMMSTVSRAAASLRSTQKTRAPSRAKVTAVHLPLPQPGPLEPAPTTIATRSFNLPAIARVSRPPLPSWTVAHDDIAASPPSRHGSTSP